MWQLDKGLSSHQNKKKWLKLSLETCELGLQDPDTHVIFHPLLQKRLLRLERALGIPKAEQHTFAHVALRPPVVREFMGVRLDDRDIGKKSAWTSTRDATKEISVEELCLEQYEDQGWKGFHSENGVVTTIVYHHFKILTIQFALLFWDILFLPLPGVFETPYQTAPLDLATDAFSPLRRSEINARLAELENGHGPNILRRTYEREKGRETWCVGLSWTYALEDLLEIVDVLSLEGDVNLVYWSVEFESDM